MSNIPDPPTTVNALPRPIKTATAIGELRNQALPAWALAEAVHDAIESLPPGTIDERLQMLMALCEEKCGELFTGVEELAEKPL